MKTFVCILIFVASFVYAQNGEIPITTTSDEARALYTKGRDHADRSHTDEAKRYFQQAVAKDSSFALARFALASYEPTVQGIFTSFDKVFALADKVSEGERLMILSQKAFMENNIPRQQELLERLVQLYPKDKRAHELLGIVYQYWLQEPGKTVTEYRKAIDIDPNHASAYNFLGYAYSAMENYPEAEKAFKKYTELLPNESNPHDSYAELLMKMGKFDESIAEYKKSLSIDPSFSLSLIGLGMNYALTGRHEEGRTFLKKVEVVTKEETNGRQARAGTVRSYLDERNFDKALEVLNEGYKRSRKQNDLVSMANARITMSAVLIEAGRTNEAAKELQKAHALVSDRKFPTDQKAFLKPSLREYEIRIALRDNKAPVAKSRLQEFKKSADESKSPIDLRTYHQLAGMLALEEKRYGDAVTELQQADQRNARTLFLLGKTYAAKRDTIKAKEFFLKAAHFNEMTFDFVCVRPMAMKELAAMK